MRQAIVPARRRPEVNSPRQSRPYTFISPVGGWVTNQNLSNAPQGIALVLDNWFPTQTGIELRGGTALYATIGTDEVESLFTYVDGPTEKLFAADEGNIFEITTIADPEVAPSADVTGLSGGEWTFLQFETSGGNFLVGVNGADTPREYDGSSWSSSTITGTGLTPANLSHVWAFKERLMFTDGSLSFWYLPTGQKTGTAVEFSLAGVLGGGGGLLFGATWSLDAGDGVDDLCLFVSTVGEVAVYQGNDPSSAANWSLVGVYTIPEPLGKNAHERVGGELFVATVEGIIPISAAVNADEVNLSLVAVSLPIEPTWITEASNRRTYPWSLKKHSEKNRMYVGMPSPGSSVEKLSFVVNAETRAWCRFTGTPWDIWSQTCLAGVHYVGGADGKIYQTETTGSDNGELYTCVYVGHFDHLRARASTKSVNLARASFRATKSFLPKVSVSTNYLVATPAAPSSVADSTDDTFDSGLWDTAVWDATSTVLVTSEWTSIAAAGFVIAPQVQVTCGVTPKPDAELMSVDLIFEVGGVVV